MEVTTSELIQALRLTNIFAISGMANVVLEITETGEFNVFSHGSNRGGSTNKVYGVVKEGYGAIRVAFNTKYLLDACSACGTQHLKLKFSGKNTALVIETEIKDYLQLVMPIRIDV